MEAVTLKPLFHNNMECIGIYSRQNSTLNHYFQKKAGARWSRTNKCWYMPCTEKNYKQLCKALSGTAIVDVAELKKYLLEKKKDIPVADKNIALTKKVTPKALPAYSKPA